MSICISPPAYPALNINTGKTNVVISGVGLRGEKGADGAAGGALLTYPAGETLSGHVVVAVAADGRVYRAGNDDQTALAVAGFTTGASLAGEVVAVQHTGLMPWPAANLVAGELIFLGVDGGIAQAMPTAGYALAVGVALTNDFIFVNLSTVYKA